MILLKVVPNLNLKITCVLTNSAGLRDAEQTLGGGRRGGLGLGIISLFTVGCWIGSRGICEGREKRERGTGLDDSLRIGWKWI